MNTARYLQYVWPFFNITHGKVKAPTIEHPNQKSVSKLRFYYNFHESSYFIAFIKGAR